MIPTRIQFSLVVILAFTALIPVPGFPQTLNLDQTVEPGVILVQYESGIYPGKAAYPSALDVQSVETAFPFLENLTGKRGQLASVQALKHVYRVRYEADLSPFDAAMMVENSHGVNYAEPQYRYFTDPIPLQMNQAPGASGKQASLIPNDPRFTNDGYMKMMEITKAWDVVKAEDAEVVIAFVDSGIDWEHPDLMANLWTNPDKIENNGVDDDGNGFIDDVHGWNFNNNSNDAKPLSDRNTHGTAVAGTAVAVADNGIGMAGTSWNAKFMPVNSSCDFLTNAICHADDGVLYAAVNGAHIINASYGSLAQSITTAGVYQTAEDLGSLVVTAAGNYIIELGRSTWITPGSYLSTLNVCGTAHNSYRNVYTYGYTVDVCTVGEKILTTTLNNRYGRHDGTSLSAPLTAGIAALVKARFPEFTPQQIREQIRATADDQIYDENPPRFSGRLGRGYVNAYRAVTETDNIAVRMVDSEIADQNNDGRFDLSEQINLTATFESFLADGENLTIQMMTDPGHTTFLNGDHIRLDRLEGGEQITIDFLMKLLPSAPYRSLLFLVPHIRTPEGELVSGSEAVRLHIHEAQLALHETDTFKYTMTSEGNIGFVDFSKQIYYTDSRVTGQMTVMGQKFTAFAGLIIGTGPSRIAGSVFIGPSPIGSPPLQNMDFVPADQIMLFEGKHGEQISRVTLRERSEKLPAGLDIVQESLTDSQSQFEDIALFRYRLRNPTGSAMKGLRIGLYFSVSASNEVDMSTYLDGNVEEMLPYMKLNVAKKGYLGFAVLSHQARKHYRTYADGGAKDYLQTLRDKWGGFTGGIVPGVKSGKDNDGQLFASGPYTVDAFSEVVVDFAMIYGTDLDDLKENARRMHLLQDRWIHPASISAPTSIDIMEGETGSLKIALWAPPSEDVHIVFSGHEATDLRIDPDFLTFRSDNWSTTQTVALHTIEDNDNTDDTVTLTLTARGGGYETMHNIAVTITDHMALDVSESEIPQQVTLWGNYPNPLSDATNIEFDLPAPAHVSVIMVDLLGRTVKNLPYGWFGSGRSHTIEMNTSDLTSGVYYYLLRIDSEENRVTQAGSMTIVR